MVKPADGQAFQCWEGSTNFTESAWFQGNSARMAIPLAAMPITAIANDINSLRFILVSSIDLFLNFWQR